MTHSSYSYLASSFLSFSTKWYGDSGRNASKVSNRKAGSEQTQANVLQSSMTYPRPRTMRNPNERKRDWKTAKLPRRFGCDVSAMKTPKMLRNEFNL